jgi:hypothetical protein
MASFSAFWESPTLVRRWQETTRAKLHRLNRLLEAQYDSASLD